MTNSVPTDNSRKPSKENKKSSSGEGDMQSQPRRSMRNRKPLKATTEGRAKSASSLYQALVDVAYLVSQMLTTLPIVQPKGAKVNFIELPTVGEELETCASTSQQRELLKYHQMLDCLPTEDVDPVESYIWKAEKIIS